MSYEYSIGRLKCNITVNEQINTPPLYTVWCETLYFCLWQLLTIFKTLSLADVRQFSDKAVTKHPPHHKCIGRLLSLLLLLLRPLNGLISRTTWVSRHQKGKPFWILLQQETMGWQWHQLDHMQIICTSLQTDNHASTFVLQAGCPSSRAQPTASKHWRQLPCEMFVLKHRHDPELSEVNCHARLTHSKQLLKNIHAVMLASFCLLTKHIDSDQTKNPAEWRTHPSNKKKDVVTKRVLSSPSFSHWWHQISATVSGSRLTGLSCEDTARQSCTMVHRWWIFGDFLRPVFPASLMQHVSDLHSKFILRPQHVWKYGRHPICGRWD